VTRKRYRGDSRVSNIQPEPNLPHTYIQVLLPPEDIYFLTKVMEGYFHLGFVSPIKPKEGLVSIHTTPGTYGEVLEILAHYPRPLTILSPEPPGRSG
jgi:hypothetical protein